MKEILTVIMSLVGVVFLIFLTYYWANWLNKRVRLNPNSSVKVVERVSLGQDRAIMIVSIGEKYMMLGVTGQHIDKIADLDKADMDKIIADKNAHTPQPFATTLLNVLSMKKAKGGETDDKE